MKHLHGSQEIEEYKKKRYAKMIKSYVKTALLPVCISERSKTNFMNLDHQKNTVQNSLQSSQTDYSIISKKYTNIVT